MTKTKYFSTFTGIGGFELGIGEKGECVGYSEIDPYADAIYKNHYPTHKNYGDITKIKEKDLPDFDLLVGGFPCQAFSVAGKRKGFDDTRGTLFFDIARILKCKRPRLLLLENVKGLLSHENGNTFKTIITTLTKLGYDIQWQVLNSKNHGVPQNRERVLIVGHLRGTPRPKVFPIGGEIETIDRTIFIDESQYRREGKVREYKGTSPTLNTAGGGGHIPLVVQKPYTQNPKMRDYEKRKQVGAITASVYKEPPVVNGIRRLTPLECERLQAYPDYWTAIGSYYDTKLCAYVAKQISDSQRYKVLGNGITTNVVRDVIDRMLE